MKIKKFVVIILIIICLSLISSKNESSNFIQKFNASRTTLACDLGTYF